MNINYRLYPAALLLASLTVAAPSYADTVTVIDDTTLVRVFTGQTPASFDASRADLRSAPWGDVVTENGPGDLESPYQTFRAVITRNDAKNKVSWQIFTNLPVGGTFEAAAADLFISLDKNDTWNRAVSFRDLYAQVDGDGKLLPGVAPKLYVIDGVTTDGDGVDYMVTSDPSLWGSDIWGYGGLWSNCGTGDQTLVKGEGEGCEPGKQIPVKITDEVRADPNALASPAQVANFRWTPGVGTSFLTSGVIEFDIVNAGADWDDFTWIWGTADCGNDTIHGLVAPVPEPSSTALLLAGLAGLGFYARRRRRVS